MTTFRKTVSAAALATAFVAGAAIPSWAGTLPVNSNAMKSEGSVVQARWHGGWGHHGGWVPGAIFGGIAAGIAGATIADGPYYGYYDGPYAYDYPYGYGGPYYRGPYVYGPRW